MIKAPVFQEFSWLQHGFGLRDSVVPTGIRSLKQIHSGIVLDALNSEAAVCEGDALVSGESGVLIGVKTADCVPILLADPVTRSVAAIHAGWRGTAENIAGVTVRTLRDRFGVKPGNLVAAVGPAIGKCCYEVGPEVASRFGIQTAEKTHLDLPRQNEILLREAGVKAIWTSGECTYCSPDRFFSFRREREQAGRMMSFIGRQ